MKSWRALTLAAVACAPVVALAQGASTGAAAFVNGTVISNYDLDQRTALFVATSGVQLTNETLPQIRVQVLRALEDELIELQEAAKHRITVAQPEIDKALQSIAADNKLSVADIMSTIEKAGVSKNTFAQQMTAQIIWQKLVVARFGTDVLISDQDVEEGMSRLRQGADRPQFLLSEIYMGVNKADDELKVRNGAEQFVQQIMQGVSFPTIALQFSQVPSAASGGDIGWVTEGQMAEEIDRALADSKPGQIVGPVRAEGGYYILLVRDRREPVGTKVADAPAPLPGDIKGPLPLDRLLIPLGTNPDAAIKDRAMKLAADIKGKVRSCGDLAGISNQLQGSVYQRLGTMDPKDMSAELRDALKQTGPGEMVQPYISQAGLEVIMRCDTPPPGLKVFELPSRDELRQQLFTQKMSVYAKSYLQELRRTAIVSEAR
jgi:peptidyl-prolyl cis-trans isomerase SurA